ncbi:MAG: hypothetical protein MZV70_17335 [Desulfobacterales bacterium]|nr:hypothetical protein [Desulfobacterales bacterium]
MDRRTHQLRGLCDRAPAVLVNDEQAGPIAAQDAEKVCQGWQGIPHGLFAASSR